jgi:hypothetical protein
MFNHLKLMKVIAAGIILAATMLNPEPAKAEEYCSDYGVAIDGCDNVTTCCDSNGECRYETDGETFYCNYASDCSGAAQDLVDYCEDQNSFLGCTAAGPIGGAPWWTLLVGALFVLRLRSRRSQQNQQH